MYANEINDESSSYDSVDMAPFRLRNEIVPPVEPLIKNQSGFFNFFLFS
jgi:hypothetical protein